MMRSAVATTVRVSPALLVLWTGVLTAQQTVPPDGWFLTGYHRARYENVANHPFNLILVDDEMLSLRTSLAARYRSGPFTLGGELLDARSYLATPAAVVYARVTNPVDILQAWVQYESDLFGEESLSSIKVGRFTMDVGSRRLVARNGFRNAINAFTGFHFRYRRNSTEVEAFAALPVSRRPFSFVELADNDPEFDRENFDNVLWGALVRRTVVSGMFVEGYLIGVLEDQVRSATGRRLITPGVRLTQPARPGRLDYEIEAAAQFGTSIARNVAAPPLLNNRSVFLHVSVGYTLPEQAAARITAQFDYASGDGNVTDDRSSRFDTLYGARRWEYGPTGIWRIFGRGNVITPGARLELEPIPGVDVLLAYRAFRWARGPTFGFPPPSAFLGHQIEGRLRWQAVSDHVTLEAGFAYLDRGGALGGGAPFSQPNPRYFYTQTVLSP